MSRVEVHRRYSLMSQLLVKLKKKELRDGEVSKVVSMMIELGVDCPLEGTPAIVHALKNFAARRRIFNNLVNHGVDLSELANVDGRVTRTLLEGSINNQDWPLAEVLIRNFTDCSNLNCHVLITKKGFARTCKLLILHKYKGHITVRVVAANTELRE